MRQVDQKANPDSPDTAINALFRVLSGVLDRHPWVQLFATGVAGAGLAAALFTTVAGSTSAAAITGALVALTGITVLLAFGVGVVYRSLRGLSWLFTAWVVTFLTGALFVVVGRSGLDTVSAVTIGVGLASVGAAIATNYVANRTRDRITSRDRILGSLADESLVDKVHDIQRLAVKSSIALSPDSGQIQTVVASLRSHYIDSPGYTELVEALARMMCSRLGNSPIYLSGLDLHAGDFTAANFENCDLTRTTFTHGALAAARFRGANLAQADLSYADLSGADLTLTILDGADLAEAFLVRADLSGSRLVGANLRGAVLLGATLVGTNLDHADLSNAVLDFAAINADLSVSTGLSHAQLERSRLNDMMS